MLLDPGTHGVRQPSAQRARTTTSSPPAPGCAAPVSSRCRMSRRGGWRASPRPATSCQARRARRGRAHPADRRRRQPGRAVPLQPRSAGDRRGGTPRHPPASPSPAIPRAIRRSMRARWMRRCRPRWRWRASAGSTYRWSRSSASRRRRSCAGSRRERAQGIDCPVHVGVAGPATSATLAKFAIRCGIGASLRALARGHTAFARIMVETGPDGLIGELVAGEDDAMRFDRGPACLHLRWRAPHGGVDPFGTGCRLSSLDGCATLLGMLRCARNDGVDFRLQRRLGPEDHRRLRG